jgi:hypothetical protein
MGAVGEHLRQARDCVPVAAARPIAVVLDGPPTPAWQARSLAGLKASATVDVVELRLAGCLRRSVARRIHTAIERHIFGLGADPYAPTRVAPYEASESPATLVVWLSERPLPYNESRELLSLRHGGVLQSAEDAFRRAVLSSSAYVESEVLLRRKGVTIVADRTVSGVRPFSETLSRTLALWKLTAVVPRALERLPGLDVLAPAPARVGPPPSTAALLARAARSWLRVLGTRLLFRRPWSIRVRERGAGPTRGWEREDGLVRWGAARTYADPFLFEHEGRHHLFCEEVPLNAKRGVISHTELRLDGTPADPPTPVLRAPWHLSYPFLFAHEGEVFMVPETSAVHRVELYRAVVFPHTWEREAILLDDIDAVDATILAHDGRLWLFAGVAAMGASSADELHLFWADTPRGPWCPHLRNPVVSDVRCARPAGAIQRWGARIVRPGQDCSRRYGGAISFRAIDVLNPTAYAEHEIDRLEPANVGDTRATHTYTADGRFEAIDLRRRELRLRRRIAWSGRGLWPHLLGRMVR